MRREPIAPSTIALVVHDGAAIGRATADRLEADGAIVRTADPDASVSGTGISDAVAEHGRLDVLAIALSEVPDHAPDDDVLRSAFFALQAAVAVMPSGGRVCIAAAPRPADIGSDVPAPATLVEGGLVAMVRLLAAELAPDIRVNAVCPVGAGADPVAVAAAVAFLASADASYVTGAFVPVT